MAGTHRIEVTQRWQWPIGVKPERTTGTSGPGAVSVTIVIERSQGKDT